MAKCKNCRETFSYKQILKSLLINGKISCSKCNAENEVEIICKFTFYISAILLPMFLNLLFQNLDMNPNLILTLYLTYIFIIISISPFLIKYE